MLVDIALNVDLPFLDGLEKKDSERALQSRMSTSGSQPSDRIGLAPARARSVTWAWLGLAGLGWAWLGLPADLLLTLTLYSQRHRVEDERA